MPEYSDYVESRIAAPTIDGTELMAGSKDGQSRQWTTQQVADLAGVTDEFNRAFSQELLFDKRETDYTPHVLTGDVTYSVAASGNLVNKFCTIAQTITLDGLQSINFTGFNYIYGIANGGIPLAGTYQIFFMYRNGVVICFFAKPSSQAGTAMQLAAPVLTAVADGENDIDLSWPNVTGNQGYLVEYSLDGLAGWTTIETTAVDAMASTLGGLAAGDTRFFRITTLGDGVTTLNSVYGSAASTTDDVGDVTPPTFTFSPINGATEVGVAQPIIATASEPVRLIGGVVITNLNAASIFVLKETNGAGANIAFTATVDATKTIFTLTPTSGYGGNQLVFVEVDGVEDSSASNPIAAPQSITFTTSAWTTFNGTSNVLKFGDILDPVWTLPDTKFKLLVTVRNLPLSGDRFMPCKYSTTDNMRSWVWWTTGNSVRFTYCRVGSSAARVIDWANVLDALEHDLELRYDGSIDTNDGLDRLTLLIDAVDQVASKTLLVTAGILPVTLTATDSQVAFGAGVRDGGTVTAANYFAGEAKDFQILSGVGDVNELEVPILREGTDVSGNARHGTWV